MFFIEKHSVSISNEQLESSNESAPSTTPNSSLLTTNYYSVADDYLIACFDDNVTDEIVEQIAKKKPYYFVMRDSSRADSSVAVNFEQLFKAYSADTIRMVL